MPLNINKNVCIACAVTGSGGTLNRNPNLPCLPQQIVESAIKTAQAGAAMMNLPVRMSNFCYR
ncbi:MAG: 3-keto-5-aminohexanoate cleavage protein [Arenicella sp.]